MKSIFTFLLVLTIVFIFYKWNQSPFKGGYQYEINQNSLHTDTSGFSVENDTSIRIGPVLK